MLPVTMLLISFRNKRKAVNNPVFFIEINYAILWIKVGINGRGSLIIARQAPRIRA
jgi:hypothetical protein